MASPSAKNKIVFFVCRRVWEANYLLIFSAPESIYPQFFFIIFLNSLHYLLGYYLLSSGLWQEKILPPPPASRESSNDEMEVAKEIFKQFPETKMEQ